MRALIVKDAPIKMPNGLIKRVAQNKCASIASTDVFIRSYLLDKEDICHKFLLESMTFVLHLSNKNVISFKDVQ